ncbi:hypothetical protein PLESTF_001534400 [Pleodorina starrii]|nr:hypothetical protein PLESTF_001534400 [Pleodorina starrii]
MLHVVTGAREVHRGCSTYGEVGESARGGEVRACCQRPMSGARGGGGGGGGVWCVGGWVWEGVEGVGARAAVTASTFVDTPTPGHRNGCRLCRVPLRVQS